MTTTWRKGPTLEGLTRVLDADGWTVATVNTEHADLIAAAPAMRDYLAAFIGAIDRKGYEDQTLTEMAREAYALLASLDGD